MSVTTVVTVPLSTSTIAVPAAGASAREFVAWVARTPRTYADVMEAWRSSCPRFSVWEDALHAGLVQIERAPGGKFGEDRVTLTVLGRAVLSGG